MKNFGLIIFIAALAIGLTFSTNCNFSGKIGKIGGVQGSGTSRTEKRNVSGFNKIDVGNAINVEVAVGGGFSVEVTADDNLLANIKTEASGDTLKIYSADSISSKTSINVRVSMPEIENFEASGASSGVLTNVRADDLELKASGASKIKIQGTAQEINAEVSGASSLEALDLKTEDAKVEASGASSARVSATGELDANASGASKIIYSDAPKNIKQDASGASSISAAS